MQLSATVIGTILLLFRSPTRVSQVMSLARHFDLVIFDWAGTMVDFGCRAPVNTLLEAFSRHGVSLTEQEVRRDMGKAKADHVHALLDDARIAAA
jgi:phosphonoacetaldehyde hydrolase